MRTLPMLVLVFTAAVAGCGLKQDYPQREFFSVDPGPAPTARAAAQHDVVLRVAPVRIASPYSSSKFVYRTAADTYESDYYNGFVDSPDKLLTAQLTEWLSRAGLFRSAISADSSAAEDLQMETNVIEMYGDFRQAAAPRAVIAARFFILDRHEGSSSVLFERRYQAAVPLKGAGAAALAEALGQAYRQVLVQLTADLRRASLPTPAPAQAAIAD